MLLASPDAGAAPLEDQPGWDCTTQGNRICGPGNDQGAPAGCYDDGGVWVAQLPCSWLTLRSGTQLLWTHEGEVQEYLPSQ